MAEVASAYVTLLPSARGFGRRLESDVSGETRRAGSGVGAVFGKAFAVAGAAVAGAKVVDFLRGSIGAASDLAETQTKVNQIFGKDGVKAVRQFASQGAKALGQTKQEVLDAASTFGIFGKSAGLSGTDLAKFSTGFAGLSTDLASFFNTDPAEAVEAIGAALRGESEPIRKYGVLLDDATLRARAFRLGIIKTTKKALTPQQRVLAAQAEIYAQTKDAQGDFARTSGGLANQQRILAAQFKNLQATIGRAFLPVATKVVKFLNNLGPAFKSVEPFLRPILNAFSSFGQGSGRASARMEQFRATLTSVFGSLKSIFQSTVSIVTSLWEKFGDTLTSSFFRQMQALLNTVKGVFNIIAGIFRVVAALLKGDWSDAWEGIKQIARGALQVIVGAVQNFGNLVRTIFGLLGDGLVGLMRAAWSGVAAASRNGALGLVQFVRTLPARIVEALGDLSKVLLDAGKQLIQGLMDGITDKFGDLKDLLGNITDKIPDLKGPPNRDRKLLRPNGRLVMDGFITGIGDRVPNLEKRLGGLTADIPRVRMNAVQGVVAATGSDLVAGGRSGPMFQVDKVVAQDVNDFLYQMQQRSRLASADGIER